MDLIRLILVLENKLSDQQKQDNVGLQRQCFGDVDPVEAKECFCAESFARLLAYVDEEINKMSSEFAESFPVKTP